MHWLWRFQSSSLLFMGGYLPGNPERMTSEWGSLGNDQGHGHVSHLQATGGCSLARVALGAKDTLR
jgi:hypothetical protein